MVDAARVLVEESGLAALTTRALAEHLGIKAPSLYKHFPDKAAVEVELIALSLIETARTMEAAETRYARSATAPTLLTALADAYRADALAHPHLYCLATEGPLPRHALPEGLEERAAMPLLRACDFDIDRARAIWAFAHGMVILEIHGRFPDGVDLTAAWRAGVEALERH
ncbi:TetR/AcrR family transcriptional regulator [Streptomyces sp. NPDC059477]|uniref:TetR/AcrR family transcriptional regulator n=1 Tax=Streptomyces sp. NPDC059477 TaxID=3346847 RepID=UPI0036B083AC